MMRAILKRKITNLRCQMVEKIKSASKKKALITTTKVQQQSTPVKKRNGSRNRNYTKVNTFLILNT